MKGFLPHAFFSIIKFSMKIRETIGDQMKRKKWMTLGLVASSMVMLTGCYQRYQRQSSPKKEATTSQTSAKNKRKKQITNNYTSLFFQTTKRFLPLQKI